MSGLLATGFVGWQAAQQTIFAKALVLTILPANAAPTVAELGIVIPDMHSAYYRRVRAHIQQHCRTGHTIEAIQKLATCLRRLCGVSLMWTT